MLKRLQPCQLNLREIYHVLHLQNRDWSLHLNRRVCRRTTILTLQHFQTFLSQVLTTSCPTDTSTFHDYWISSTSVIVLTICRVLGIVFLPTSGFCTACTDTCITSSMRSTSGIL